jgi:predicted HicB family RNase H-like nuclease
MSRFTITISDEDEEAGIPLGDPPARAGRVALTLRIEPELHRKLRARAYRTDCTIQDIILEALERMGV